MFCENLLFVFNIEECHQAIIQQCKNWETYIP